MLNIPISLRREFDNSIREIFRPDISLDDFPGVNLEDAPLYDMYEDDTTNAEGGLADNSGYNEIPLVATGSDHQFPTPKLNDNYVNSSFMFPRGDNYARQKVIVRKIDSSRNYVGRRNNNPALDTREYSVEFDDE